MALAKFGHERTRAEDRSADSPWSVNFRILANTRDQLVDLALKGDRQGACDLVVQAVRQGTSKSNIIDAVLTGVQREVGERWHNSHCSVVDEHVATEVVLSALEAVLAMPVSRRGSLGSVVVACANGDWHGLAAKFQAELLAAEGWSVSYLGPSAPSEQVQSYLQRNPPTALVITCSYSLALIGAARLTECAHSVGVPVLIGGSAVTPLHLGPRLGGDGDPTSVGEIVEHLETWAHCQRPPTLNATRLQLDAVLTNAEVDRLAILALAALSIRLPNGGYNKHERARGLEELSLIIRFACAALLVQSCEVFTEFMAWFMELLTGRSVPRGAILDHVAVLREVIGDAAVGDRAKAMHSVVSVLG
jgi:methanogenic corrinoid protein MtbC1